MTAVSDVPLPRTAAAVGRLLAMVVLASACTTTPVNSARVPVASDAPAALGPAKHTGTRVNDVVVALAVEHDRAPAGERFRARADVTNLGLGPVAWQSGGCGLFNGLKVSGPDVPAPPPGREWAGTAHWAKWAATVSGNGFIGFLPPDVVERGQPFAFGCTADLAVDDIQPGETASVDAVWIGLASDGQPAPGGRYTLSFTFPYLARISKEQFRGDPIADAKPIKVDLDFSIDGRPGVAVPSTLAVDAALAEPRVRSWIEKIKREELYGASVMLSEGLWRIRIEIEAGAAEIAVDPSSGAVLSVELP